MDAYLDVVNLWMLMDVDFRYLYYLNSPNSACRLAVLQREELENKMCDQGCLGQKLPKIRDCWR